MKKVLSIVTLMVIGIFTIMASEIRVIQQDKMIRYVTQEGDENINNATIMVEVSASTISFALTGGDAGLFVLYNPLTAQKGSSLNDVKTQHGVVQVELRYLGDFSDALGRSVSVVVTADGETKTLTTTIEDMPTLTFLPAQSAYTVKHTNGTELTYTVAQNATTSTVTKVTEESMLTVELSLSQTTNEEYAFVGWQEILQDENGNEIVKYISYDQNCVYEFNGSAQVRPEFIHYSVATFFIKSQQDKKIAYHDFALVMKDAEELYKSTGEPQVVIFESIYTIRGYSRPSSITEEEVKVGTLASGNYTIPQGVTLLIPGDEARTCLLGDVGANNVATATSAVTLFRKLILSEATSVEVEGNICVYAELSTSQGSNGRPNSYGQIHLETNAHIIAKSGAGVYVFGYITGNPNDSYVEMQSGSIVYESFQVSDFRGGTAISGMLNNNKKVFPISQYYVQSVETRLILECGATERVCCPADMTGVGELCANAYFVSSINSNESAIFKLGEGCKFIKYYDISKDRIKYCVEGGSAKFDRIVLDLSSVNMNSADYVLPISSHMDVICNKCSLSIENDVAFLAGSSLYVDAESTVDIKNGVSVFVYDKEQHYVKTNKIEYCQISVFGRCIKSTGVLVAAGYYNYIYTASTPVNGALAPIRYRPNEGIRHIRNTSDFTEKIIENSTVYIPQSAIWTIDGQVTGAVYTTEDGAIITSNGGGKINIENINSSKKTYQGLQHASTWSLDQGEGFLFAVSFVEVPISIAQLKNTYDYAQGVNGNTYVYDATQGKWVQNGTTTPVVDNEDYTPTFTVAPLSILSAYVGKTTTANVAITTDNANVVWNGVTWSYQITGLSANQFTSTDVTSAGSTVTFAPTSAGSNKTATMKIIASYVANQKMYTYEQTVELTGEALAIANDLDFTLSAITTEDGAKPLFQGGNGGAIDITNKNDLSDFVTLTSSDDNNWTIEAKDGVNTTITVQATQVANGNVLAAGISKIITIGSGKQALMVPIEVGVDNFEQVTWAKSSGVQFENGLVMSAHSQWTAFFAGTPDKLKFTPTTISTWQVEEYDGKGWNILYSWATIAKDKEFALSLSPTASKVRIRCAKDGGTLKDLKITALTDVDVKANVDTLFIPIVKGETETITRTILLTYLSEELVSLSTSNPNLLTLDAAVLDPADDEYKQQVITLTSNAQAVGEYHISVNVGDVEKLQIPIIVYEVPQELPIMLENDVDKYRYYYVTSVSQHAIWDASKREIVLKNELGSCAPSVTFAFDGAPTYISFNAENVKGQWHVEWSEDDNSWENATVATAKKTENSNEYLVSENARYIRVTYESLYAESVVMSNLMIVGEPGLIVDPLKMTLTNGENPLQEVMITAINLASAPTITASEGFEYTETSIEGTIANNSVALIKGTIEYKGTLAVAYGTLTVTYEDKSVVVELTGLSPELGYAETGIMTGVNLNEYDIEGVSAYDYHNVNIANTYTKDGETYKTLFDYLIIYGETKPASGDKITKPTAKAGSNAITPCFIYKANDGDTKYELHKYVENTNTSNKVLLGETDLISIDGSLDVYMTGFCPYASTGYTKASEGVWYFQGNAGETLNVYLEDCHIYSRNKTEDGHPFQSKQDGNSFTESYVRGSGGVFVFECAELSNTSNAFNVNIHTRGKNLLKSNHGCFFDILGYRAYQVSSPVQIHMKDENYVAGSRIDLTFDDLWPNTTSLDGDFTRTNGYLALKKQVNNAPSIDMGNTNTVVNFRGGQVHLENAQIVSTNYQTTLAICYRSGKMGGIEFPFAHGIGTDDVGGTVNFYDGTTTVEPMEVDAKHRQYYLMDTDDDGNELTTTSCLRTPTNTYIYGGSHCMMRACQNTTSKGGAPKSGPDGEALGLYRYPSAAVVAKDDEGNTMTDDEGNPIILHKGGWTDDNKDGLVEIPVGNLPNERYGVESITPNDNGTEDVDSDDYLNFWVTEDYDDSVIPEIDKNTKFWSACMTKIEASMNSIGGFVGGETYIDDNTEVQNLLYCKIDKDIYDAITDPNYVAPVKVPSTEEYTEIPISVERVEGEGDNSVLQNYITNTGNYTIEDRVYYVTTATADMWMTFAAPFDVENIYVVETYSEDELSSLQATETLTQRKVVMKEQAKHNADFAAFYGVAMAIYNQSSITFWDIYDDYLAWAKWKEGYSASSNYTRRGKYELQHYNGSNYSSAQYYLYENKDNWKLSGNDDGVFVTEWDFPDVSDGILMNEGEVYSLLFPYCVGCGDYIDGREDWDYWSGKFIIFESTPGGHEIKGSSFVAPSDPSSSVAGDWVFEDMDANGGYAIVTGNRTFAQMTTKESDLYVYTADQISQETFYRNVGWDEEEEDYLEKESIIKPTSAFLLATSIPSRQGMPVRSISRDGKINYGPSNGNDDGSATGGHVPTINGGSDLFVTSRAEGINIAVSEPQAVGVFSATGALLYSGWVETSVDVNLVVNGVYVVVGENNSVKVIY